MLRDKLNLALIAGIVIAVCGILIYSPAPAVKAQAVTSMLIRNQDSTQDVATITFPPGSPGATVSNPSNDKAETQVFGGAGVAQPVVTIQNGAAVPYVIWYNISSFTEGVVASEYYVILAEEAECLNDDAVNLAVTFGVNTSTGIEIGATTNMDLYLKVNLAAVAGKSGTSTITILGEEV